MLRAHRRTSDLPAALDPLEPRTLLSAVAIAHRDVDVHRLNQGYAVVEGDFNNDGRADVITRAYGLGTARYQLHLNRSPDPADRPGRIRFGPGRALPLDLPTPTAVTNSRLLAGDFDGDGNLDLLVIRPLARSPANPTGGVRLRLLKGDGRGDFAPGPEVLNTRFDHAIYSFRAASLDGPGVRDSVVAWHESGVSTFKIGNRGRVAVVRDVYSAYRPSIQTVHVGDLNGDQRDDIVFYAQDFGTGGLRLLLADAPGRLTWVRSIPYDFDNLSTNIVLADRDFDGRDEVLTTRGPEVVSFSLVGDADSGYTTTGPELVTIIAGPPPFDGEQSRSYEVLEAADVNSDRVLDLLAAVTVTGLDRFNLPTNRSVVSLLIGDENSGQFASHTVAYGSRGPGIIFSDWALRDFDGDGVRDVFDGSLRTVRRVVIQDRLELPTVSALRLTHARPADGLRRLIASGVSSPQGQVIRVEFFFDANDDGALAFGDLHLGGASGPNAGGRWVRVVRQPDAQLGAPGVSRFFAYAVNDLGFRGEPVTVEIILA